MKNDEREQQKKDLFVNRLRYGKEEFGQGEYGKRGWHIMDFIEDEPMEDDE